jgi:hypothetical protein
LRFCWGEFGAVQFIERFVSSVTQSDKAQVEQEIMDDINLEPALP